MLELVGNTLAHKTSSIDDDNQFVNSDCISKLHYHLQDSEGLHLGNKLRETPLPRSKKKMNVNLAAQLLSKSVASSLEFCLQEGMSEFQGC